MDNKYGRLAKFKKVAPQNKVMLNQLFWYGLQFGKGTRFTVAQFLDYVEKNHSTFDTGVRKRDITYRKCGSFLSYLARVKGVLSTVHKKPHQGKPQLYVIKSINYKVSNGTIPSVEKGAEQPAEPVQEKRKLNVADAINLDDYDLAFIGYTIRTELDILNKQRDHLEKENIHLKAENKKLLDNNEKIIKENNVKAYQVALDDAERDKQKITHEKNEEINQHKATIEKLNGRIIDMQSDLDVANNQIYKLKRALEIEEAKKKGFTMGEITTGKRPAHLNPSGT